MVLALLPRSGTSLSSGTKRKRASSDSEEEKEEPALSTSTLAFEGDVGGGKIKTFERMFDREFIPLLDPLS